MKIELSVYLLERPPIKVADHRIGCQPFFKIQPYRCFPIRKITDDRSKTGEMLNAFFNLDHAFRRKLQGNAGDDQGESMQDVDFVILMRVPLIGLDNGFKLPATFINAVILC